VNLGDGYEGWTWDMGVAQLSEYGDTGVASIQVDNYGGGGVTMEQHSPYGFFSVPLDPDAESQPGLHDGGGCLSLVAWEGNRGHAWALNDLRVTKKLPKLKKGGSIQYGATGSFDLIDGIDGSQRAYVPYQFTGTVAAKAMLVSIDVSAAGAEQIQIVHGDGMAITMIAGGKHSIVIKNKAGDAYIELNDDGIILNGNVKIVGAASIGVPPPSPDLTQPLVNETTLLAWINAVLIPALALPAPAKVVLPLVPGIVGCQFAKGL
jgi:hypothetical protein